MGRKFELHVLPPLRIKEGVELVERLREVLGLRGPVPDVDYSELELRISNRGRGHGDGT